MDLHLNPAPLARRDVNAPGMHHARQREPVRHYSSPTYPGRFEERRISTLLLHLFGSRHLAHARPFAATAGATLRPRSLLPALVVTLVVFLLLPLALPVAAQDAPLEVASGPLSERTMVLAGRTVQSPERLQLFGYVSGASGLTAQDLFADDTDQVGSARFTFSADVVLQPAINRADTTSYAGEGTLRVYLAANGGASWSDPATFSAGDLLAEYDLALRETLQRQALQVGVLVGDGALTQSTANTFTLGETDFRFGAEGLVERLRVTGALIPETAGSTLAAVVTGHAEVTSRDVTVVRMGETTTSPATPGATAAGETPAATSTCALEPWLGNAKAALELADQGIGGLDVSAIDTVDVNAVQGLAEQIDAAIATQRSSAVPDDATDANRLLVTALSTSSRGLRGVAAAVASGDDASFTQAVAALGDGQTLLSRAQGEIADLAASCPAG